ncbi:titin homolog isoform X2 [Pomacea canaliculata]|nr:titin homolog isoform X2 [Pomacea canaliculata]
MSPSLLPEVGGSRSDDPANGSEPAKHIDAKFFSSHIPEKDSIPNTSASGYRSKFRQLNPQGDDGDSHRSPRALGHVRHTDPTSHKVVFAEDAAEERWDCADSGKLKASETARSSRGQNIFAPSREETKTMSHMGHTPPYEVSLQVDTKHSKTQRSSSVRSNQAHSPGQEVEDNDRSNSGSVSHREHRYDGKPLGDTEQASYSNSRELYFRHDLSSPFIDVTGRCEHDVGGDRSEKQSHPLDGRQEERRLEDYYDHRLGVSHQHKQNFLITKQKESQKEEFLPQRKDEFPTHKQDECFEHRPEDIKTQAQEDSTAPPQECSLEHTQDDSQAQRQEVPEKREDCREKRQEDFQDQRQEESPDRKQELSLVQGLEDSPEHKCEGFLTYRQEDAMKHRQVDSMEHRQEDPHPQRQEVSQMQGQEDSQVQRLEDSPEYRHERSLTHKQEDVIEHRQEDPQTQRLEVFHVERQEDCIEQKREDFQVQRENNSLEHRHDSYLTNTHENSLKFSRIESMQHQKAHSEEQRQGDPLDLRKEDLWTQRQEEFSEHSQEDSHTRKTYSLEQREKDSQPHREEDFQVQRKEDFQPQRLEDFQSQGHEDIWMQRQTDSHPQSQEAAQPQRQGFQPQRLEDFQMQRPEESQSQRQEDFKQHEESWRTAGESTITIQENVQGEDYKFQSTEREHNEFAEGTAPDQCRTTQVALDDARLTFAKPLNVDIESAVLDRLEWAGIKREIWDSSHMESMANGNKGSASVCSPGEDNGGNIRGDQPSVAVGVWRDEVSQSLADDSHDLDSNSRELGDTDREGSACVGLMNSGIDNVIKKNMESEQFVSINLNVSRNQSLKASCSNQSSSPDGRELQSVEKILHSDTLSDSNEHLHDVYDATFCDRAAALKTDECSAVMAETDKQSAAKSVAEHEEEKPSDAEDGKDELDAEHMDEDIFNAAAAEIESSSAEDIEVDSVGLLDDERQHFSSAEMGKDERITLEVGKIGLSDAETKKVKSGAEAGEEGGLASEDAGNGKLSSPGDTKEFEKNTWSDKRCAAEDEEGILTTAEAEKGKLSSAEKGKTNATDDDRGKLNEAEFEMGNFSATDVEEGKVSATENTEGKLEDNEGRINVEDIENGQFIAPSGNTKFEKNTQRDKLCAMEDRRGIVHSTEVENIKLSATEHEEHILGTLEDENDIHSAVEDEEDKLNVLQNEADITNGATVGKSDHSSGKDEKGNISASELEKSKSNGLVVEKGKNDAVDVEEGKENEEGQLSAIEVEESIFSPAENRGSKVRVPKDEENKQNDVEVEKGTLSAVKEEDKLNSVEDEESLLNSAETENDKRLAGYDEEDRCRALENMEGKHRSVKGEESKLNGAEAEKSSLDEDVASASEGSLPVYVEVRSCEDSFHSDYLSTSQTSDLDILSPRSDRDSGFVSYLHQSPHLAIDETLSFDWYLLNGITLPPETANDNVRGARTVRTSVLRVVSVGTTTTPPSSDVDHTDSKEFHAETTSGRTPELSELISSAAVGKIETDLKDEANSEDASMTRERTSILPGPGATDRDRREMRTFVEEATQTAQLSFEDFGAGADTLTPTAHFDDIDNSLQSRKEQPPNEDAHHKWTLGQMLLPLYKVMVYMLTRPELPYT